jgi:hypothetical protein
LSLIAEIIHGLAPDSATARYSFAHEEMTAFLIP